MDFNKMGAEMENEGQARQNTKQKFVKEEG